MRQDVTRASIRFRTHSALIAALLTIPAASALAQSSTAAGVQAPAIGPIEMPPVIVTAQKEPADVQTLPVSVTVVSGSVLESAGILSLREAGVYAPNTYFSDLSARKVSNARFRGIGSSPANPGVTTYIDGVPQLSANSSSVGLLDIDQIEFVRGPQSALFGRNALGGIVNVTSRKPSSAAWTGRATVPLANYGARDVTGALSGPVTSTVGLGAAFTYGQRDGFSTNSITGNTVDDRSAFEGKVQLSWTPTPAWEARVIVAGERSRDGDYALADLDALGADPFSVARDFEGRTDRDVMGTTILSRWQGRRVTLSTATGFLGWRTEDVTDLDYSPMPLATRDNLEKSFQFTQEVRAASAGAAPVVLGDQVTLAWQTGVFVFTQDFEQDAVNSYSPFVLAPVIPFPVSQTTPRAAIDDLGVGLFGLVTTTLRERLAVSAGGRFDYERKDALLETFYAPPIAPASTVDQQRSFSAFSPQVSVSYRMPADYRLYGAASRGFKAGGFNPASPAGAESYDEEYASHFEGGVKSSWANGRVSANVAVFFIDWDDLQLNLPDPFVPAQFYIDNVGAATSRGLEVELNARLQQNMTLFASAGHTRGRFSDGSISMGRDVSGNPLPNTPGYTATIGAEAVRAAGARATLFARAEGVFYGAFKYDDTNTVGQEAYWLANLRGGVRGDRLSVEAWAKNVFNAEYIPVAFAFGATAPSGYLGEPGRPRTFGVSLGVGF
jgi:iron complex outermembrane receptor protein